MQRDRAGAGRSGLRPSPGLATCSGRGCSATSLLWWRERHRVGGGYGCTDDVGKSEGSNWLMGEGGAMWVIGPACVVVLLCACIMHRAWVGAFAVGVV